MKLYKIILLMTIVSTLLFMVGCSDRGVNYGKKDYTISEGGIVEVTGAHVFHDELLFQINNQFQQMSIVGYVPRVVIDDFQPVPLLILLPPQDADAYFYFQHGLKELADELISQGVIQPMAFLCLPNDQVFGGYFFAGNSPAAGMYDDLIGSTLIDYAHNQFLVTTIDSQAKRAIGGMGMGAYGAFRAAMINPGVFSAVSGVAGPLDFDGSDGNSGFIPLFQEALNEQGLTASDNLKDTFKYKDVWYLSRLFIGGSFAFSPHDTAYDYTRVTFSETYNEYYLDSLYALDTAVFPLSEAISYPLFAELPNPFEDALSVRNRFHLPFDNTGSIVQPVWDLWMNNNLENIFMTNTSAFNNVNIWIGNSSESAFGNYNTQTDSWASFLNSQSVSLTTFNLNGYDGHPAEKDQYVYDYLREMLIFHSEMFGN